MVRPQDPRAEKIRRRHEQRELRTTLRTQGIEAAFRFFINGSTQERPAENPDDAECLDCIALTAVVT